MGLFESSRDRSKRAREVYQICLFGTALGAILLLLVFLWNDAAFASSRKQSMPGSDAPNFPKPRVVRRGKAKNTFGTIYHNELMSYYGLNSARPETFAKLLGTLQDMEQANINTVLFSINWDFFEPEEDKPNWDYLNALVGTACNYTVLEVSLAFDMLHAPSWLLQKYPDSFSMDAEGRNYTTQLSWYHPAANARGLDMLHLMATHLASNFSDCVFSMQPVYNNEDEAKFTQEYDAFQDYSPPALAAFRAWLRTRRPDLADINSRWGSEWSGWEEVRPPAVLAGSSVGVETSARYWDWMTFRVESGAAVLDEGCRVVRAAGLQCFHHFPEFFSVLDAIYGAPMFKRLAASPHTDFIIMDSNFITGDRAAIINPIKLRVYLAAAVPYGKPIFFKAAVDRYTTTEVLHGAFQHALMAGVTSLGIGNIVQLTERVNVSLAAAMLAHPPCRAEELVGVFLHLDSCMAWPGLQWRARLTDPMYNFMEGLAGRLTERCETDIALYVELDRFLAALPAFSRVLFVEPLVLYGNDEFENYMAVKFALQEVPHEVLRLPTNSSMGLSMQVLEDL